MKKTHVCFFDRVEGDEEPYAVLMVEGIGEVDIPVFLLPSGIKTGSTFIMTLEVRND